MDDKEGRHLKGRFLKKNNPLLQHIKIVNFNLEEIIKTSVVIPDNPSNSIIHAKMHLKSALSDAMKPFRFEDNQFTPLGGSLPVIVPLDFTEDWRRMKDRSNRKQAFYDDEDYLYYEKLAQEEITKKAKTKIQVDEKTGTIEGPPSESSNTKELESIVASEPVDLVSLALDQIGSQIPHKVDGLHGSGLILDRKMPNLPQQAAKDSQEKPKAVDAITNDEIEKKMKEAVEKGYQDGLEKGKKDIYDQLKTEVESASSQTAHLLDDLQKLKKQILVSAQENFRTVAEVMMESLLQKEFKSNPESFALMIKRAVEEAVSDDKFTIKVHPSLLENLNIFSDPSLQNHIVADESLKEGDFTIESTQGVVDGRLNQVIRDILNQADINLENETEVAG